MALVLGLAAKLYYNTGSVETPTWTEIDNVKNVTLQMEKAQADVSTRASEGWRQRKGTLKDATVEFQMVWDTDDDAFTAIQEAFLADDEAIEILALDGPVATAGSQGLRALCDVTNFTRNEELEEAIMVDVTLVPTYGAAPTWHTTSGS